MAPLSKAAAAQSPDARPTVTVAALSSGDVQLRWVATCSTGDCEYTYGPALKTDAQQHATWHRAEHRRRAELAVHPAPKCSECGCTDDKACFLGCYWVHKPGETPLCSACALEPERRMP